MIHFEEIGNTAAEINFKKVENHFKDLSNIDGMFCNNKLWDVRKKIGIRAFEPAMAKKDKKGNLVATTHRLKELYMETYKDRLSYNPISKGLEDIKEWKEKLCEERIKFARNNKTEITKPEIHLDSVTKYSN